MKYIVLISSFAVIANLNAFPTRSKFPKKFDKNIDEIEFKQKDKSANKSSYIEYKTSIKTSNLEAPTLSKKPVFLTPSSYLKVHRELFEIPETYLIPPAKDTYSVYTKSAKEKLSAPVQSAPLVIYRGYTNANGEKSGSISPPILSSYSEPRIEDLNKPKNIADLRKILKNAFVRLMPLKNVEKGSSTYVAYDSPSKSSYMTYLQ